VLKPMELVDWILVYTELNKEDYEIAGTVYDALSKAANAYGIKIKEPKWVPVKSKKSTEFIEEIKRNVTKSTQVVLCVIQPPAKKSYYPAIKRLCCKELGVPSQVVVTKSFTNPKGVLSVASKVLLQINAKIGLPLWVT